MRTLFSVGAALRAATRLMSVGSLVAALVLTAMQANAQWQDPLETPAFPTTKAHKSLLLDITIIGERLVAVGERGHIIYSDDDGRTWRQAQVPVITTLTAVDFVDENTGWAVGHDAVVLKTQDGGLTWFKQLDGFKANEMVLNSAKKSKASYEDALNKAVDKGNDDAISLAEEALENATFALEDAQLDYDDKSTKPLLNLWFKNAKEGFVIGAYGMIFKTTDGGETWNSWSRNVENPDRFHLNGIAKIDNERLIIVGEAGLILTSKDSGNTWQQRLSPYEGSFFGVVALDNNVQLAFGLRGNLARSDDFGANWRLEDTHTHQTLMGGVTHLGLTAYVVGNGGVMLKGINAGQEWESRTRVERDNASAIVETQSGEFVMVGESGVTILDKTGALQSVKITSIKG